ncbi:hypothetical protein FGIG_09960, partial [Fasciola gigantica]
ALEQRAECDAKLEKLFENLDVDAPETLESPNAQINPVCPLRRHNCLCSLPMTGLSPQSSSTSQSGPGRKSIGPTVLQIQRGSCVDGPHDKPSTRAPPHSDPTKFELFPCHARFDGFNVDNGQPVRIDEWLIPSKRGPKGSDCGGGGGDTAKLLHNLGPQLVHLARCTKPSSLNPILGYGHLTDGLPSGESKRSERKSSNADAQSGWFIAHLVSERPRGTCLTTLMNTISDRSGETGRSFAWIRTVIQQLVNVLAWLHEQNMGHRNLQVCDHVMIQVKSSP